MSRMHICTKQTFIPHTKEGLNMLFPLHNSSSFQSNLMKGQNLFLVLSLQQIAFADGT